LIFIQTYFFVKFSHVLLIRWKHLEDRHRFFWLGPLLWNTIWNFLLRVLSLEYLSFVVGRSQSMAWEYHLVFSSFLLHFPHETMKFDLINWFLNWRLLNFEYLSIQFFPRWLVKFLVCLLISKFCWGFFYFAFFFFFGGREGRACRLPLPLTCAGGGLSLGSLSPTGLIPCYSLAAGECVSWSWPSGMVDADVGESAGGEVTNFLVKKLFF
jgi:hypothetical protein